MDKWSPFFERKMAKPPFGRRWFLVRRGSPGQSGAPRRTHHVMSWASLERVRRGETHHLQVRLRPHSALRGPLFPHHDVRGSDADGLERVGWVEGCGGSISTGSCDKNSEKGAEAPKQGPSSVPRQTCAYSVQELLFWPSWYTGLMHPKIGILIDLKRL